MTYRRTYAKSALRSVRKIANWLKNTRHSLREMESDIKAGENQAVGHAVPQLEAGVKDENDNTRA